MTDREYMENKVRHAFNKGYDVGFKDGKEKAKSQQPCDDAISRQAVDDAIYEYSRSCDVNYAQIMEYIDKLPPVSTEKTGHWVKSKDGYMRCDYCGSRGSAIKARFCHHCGARMEVEE